MKTKTCPCCKNEIGVKSRFAQAQSLDESFNEPCDQCENRETESGEMPCEFCIHG
jgi:hypothetical protein